MTGVFVTFYIRTVKSRFVKIVNLRIVVATISLVVTSACTTLAEVPGRCGSPPNQQVCFGTLKVPKARLDEYVAASQLAIDTVASPEFRLALDNFISTNAAKGDQRSAWKGVHTDEAIANLIKGFNGLSVETMNTVSGLYKHIIFGTKASEGLGEGPILVNPYYRDSRSSYANTYAHEAAHRAPSSLGHPHYVVGSSQEEKEVGLCEPPYVIGSLVERQIQGSIDPTYHCALLFNGIAPQ